jgi:fucose permease
VLALCFAAFTVFGAVLVVVGANQADLARDLDLDLAQSGLLTSALALGIGIGVVGAGPLFDRFPRRPLFVGSALLAATALLTVDAEMGFRRWLAHMFAAGVGIGAYDTLINAIVVQRYRERAARPLSLVHAGATLGAMLFPLAAGWIALHRHWSQGFTWLGAAHVALAGWVVLVSLPRPEAPGNDEDRSSLGSPALFLLGAIAFSYVGIETALTVFAVPYATDGLALGAERGRLAISAFWLGLLAGRLGVVALRGTLDARVLALAGASAAAVIALAAVAGPRVVELPFVAAGLSLGCVYPLMINLAGQRFPHARGTATGLVAGFGALGGFAVPWLTGTLGDFAGVSAALASLAFWSVAIALAAVAAGRLR